MSADLAPHFPPRRARVHEACGPGMTGFAAMLAAQLEGPVLWIREYWRPEALNPLGLSDILDPARLLVAQVKDQTDALAVAEEALRDGSLKLVVAELGEPLGLTPGRRLQLAAKDGRSTGLCLISEGNGSNAAETRWRCTPTFDPEGLDSTLQHWDLIKNKSGTLGFWHVRWDREAHRETHRLRVVSAPGERPGAAHATG